MKLWGLAGKAGAGKDTVADYLCSQYGWTRMAFADPLKAAAATTFGIPVEDFYDREKKEQMNEYWSMTPRRMAQLFGNDAMKPTFGPDFWVRRWLRSYAVIEQSDNVVISDVRFEVEAVMIRSLGGVVFQVERPGAGLYGEAAIHSSEVGLPANLVDDLILNVGDIAHLYETVDNLLARHSA